MASTVKYYGVDRAEVAGPVPGDELDRRVRVDAEGTEVRGPVAQRGRRAVEGVDDLVDARAAACRSRSSSPRRRCWNAPEPQGLLLQAIVAVGGCMSIWTSWLCAADSTLPALSIARDLTVVVWPTENGPVYVLPLVAEGVEPSSV